MFIYWSYDPHQCLRIQRSCLVIFQIFKTVQSVSFFLNRNMIKFANIFHKFVSFIREKTICERYFIINWAFLKIIFSNAKKNYILKIHGPIVLHVWIKKSNVNMCDTWLHWFFGSEKFFFFKCYFFFLSYTFFRAPESLGWLGQHFNKFDCPLPRMLCDKFNWNW